MLDSASARLAAKGAAGLWIIVGAGAAGLRVGVVALTDSVLSPLAEQASTVLTIPTQTAVFLHSMSAAFAVAEMLAALVVAERGPKAVNATRCADQDLRSRYEYLDAGHRPRRSRIAKSRS